MQLKVLVTGGAGFIGSHIVDALIERGYNVRVYDNLEPQVHGSAQKAPEYLAIFISRLLNNHPPLIFEDGNQSRDFIYVKDIVRANLLAMEKDGANWKSFNVGTGKRTTIKEVAEELSKNINPDIECEIVNKFRAGDIRHCYADISKIEETLGFKPEVSFENGIKEYLKWVKKQHAIDKMDNAVKELEEKGLTL